MHCCGHALDEAGHTDAHHYPEARPVEAERIATERAVGYCATTGATTYVVHLSSQAALAACRTGRARGLPLHVETRPIYLHLNADRFAEPDGAKYAGAPPLRTDADRDALWAAIERGDIDSFGTDHIHRPMTSKQGGIWKASPGFPGLDTFLPALFFADSPLAANGLIGLHEEMFALQSQVLQPHPYQSAWWQWLLNLRGVWYMYEVTDGAQRGVLLIGNPASMLLGLPAIIWCAYSAYAEKNPAKIGIIFGFAASIGLWLVADKSVQFYYHYLLPSTFLLAALALACEKLWDIGERGLVMIALGLTGIMFAYFYPILTAGALSDADSFGWYTWIDGWV